jgi:hypothetical protein
MRRHFLILLFFFLNCLNGAFSQQSLFRVENKFDNDTADGWINIVKADTKSPLHSFSSLIDTTLEYGAGYKSFFPDNCVNKNLRIIINSSLEFSMIDKNFSLVVSIDCRDSTIFWKSFGVADKIKANLWTTINDTIDIPLNFSLRSNSIAIYFWNRDKKSIVNVDDFSIEFYEKQFPHFIPEPPDQPVDAKMKMIYDKNGFRLLYSDSTGNINISDSTGKEIFSSLRFSTTMNAGNNTAENKTTFSMLKFAAMEENKGIENLIFVSNGTLLDDSVFLNFSNGIIRFKIITTMHSIGPLYSHSLVAGYAMNISEIYRKNSLCDTSDFKDEYWLNREGFQLGDKNSSLVFYRPDNLSSVQIGTKGKYIFFNIEFACDHPMLHFPELKKSENHFEDVSSSVFRPGDKIKSEFSFTYSGTPVFIPRLMTKPNGFLASFIWTEHADYTNLRTQKAVYFGSETVNRPDSSVGGFIGYGIPVTKSIFYSNPEKEDNKVKDGSMPGPEANYKSTDGFEKFVKQLDESGIEICLHTPDHYTTNRKLLEEALEKTRRDFMPVTWIDHGYDNSPKSNREDLACDGTDSSSAYYSADLWKKYGLKYFWNSYFEDAGVFRNFSFNSFFSVPYDGWGDAFPTPYYWRHPSRTKDIIHWRTTTTTDPPDGDLLAYYFTDQRLRDMIQNRDDIVIHCYPARVDSTTGFFRIKDGLAYASDEFNQLLARLSQQRRFNTIWLTTIRQMLDYRTSLENLSYDIEPDGTVNIHNTGKSILRGVSFAVHAKNVIANSKKINSKSVNDDLIFWMDIFPGESVKLIIQ